MEAKKNMAPFRVTLVLIVIGFSLCPISSAKPSNSDILSLPAGIIRGDNLYEPWEMVEELDLDSSQSGVQQIVTVTPGETIQIYYEGYCQDAPGGAPSPIIQHFVAYSWNTGWPPSDYHPLYNSVPSDSGEYYTDSWTITAPEEPGTYSIWVCSGHMYSMEDTVNNYDEQPGLLPHAKIIVTSDDVKQYTLTTNVVPSVAGSITLNPTGGTYDVGTTVTVTANADRDYTFEYWGGNFPAGYRKDSSFTFTMTGNKTLTAHFEETPDIEISNLDVSSRYEDWSALEKFFTELVSYDVYIEVDVSQPDMVSQVYAKMEYTPQTWSCPLNKIKQAIGIEDGPSEVELYETDQPGHFKGELKLHLLSDEDKIELAYLAHTYKSLKNGLLSAITAIIPDDLVTVDEIIVVDTAGETHVRDVDRMVQSLLDAAYGIDANMDNINLMSPGDLLIKNEANKRVGAVYEDNHYAGAIKEIDKAIYSGPKADPEYITLGNTSANYDIYVRGTGKGEYDLLIASVKNGTELVEESHGDIEKDEIIHYGCSMPKNISDLSEEEINEQTNLEILEKQTPDSDTPGFEFIMLLAAVGVASVMLRRRQ